MSASTDLTVKIILYSMIVNILFPVFAYGMTTITGSALEDFDISISEETLINAGIQFTAAESANITFKGADLDSQTFNVSGNLLRIRWDTWPLIGDRFRFSMPKLYEIPIGDLTGDYFSTGGQVLEVQSEGQEYVNDFYNSTMVANFDPAYNWTRVNIPQKGIVVLFTTLSADDNNITKAVYETGNVTATVGQRFTDGSTFDFRAFIDWYMGMLFTNKNYGLPASAAWIMRVFVAITLFSALLLARDLLPFV